MAERRNDHNKIIKAVCKEILLPLGVFQKGSSRTYLDDNGYYFTVIEFQPSQWSRGTYLNMGIDLLWNHQEYLVFADMEGARVGGFVPYENEEQFEADFRRFALLAKEKVLYFREPQNVIRSISERQGDVDLALYLAYTNQRERAQDIYKCCMRAPYFADMARERHLPEKSEDLCYDTVLANIQQMRAYWRSKPGMQKMRWFEDLDGAHVSREDGRI